MPGGHLRKAEAQAEAEAEKLLGENKTEKKRSFYEFKASLSLSNNPKFQARFRVMSFVLAKNVYSLIKALYW